MQEIEKKKSGLSGKVPIGWEVKKAFEVCGFIVPDRDKPELSDQGIPWITTPDLIGGSDISISKSNLFVSKEYAKKNNLKTVPAKSVIMTCVGDLGIVALTHNEIIINQQLHAFIPSKLIDCYFLLNALKIQRRYFEKVATKTAVPYLNKNNCNSTPILLPPLPEQRAIADCLSTWDEAIQTAEELIRQKELQKKWLMQQLLTGKKRLKGFSGEWRERKLGEFLVESRILSEDSSPDRRITVKLSLNGVEKREVRGTESKDSTLYFIRKAGQFIYGKQNLHKGAFGIIPDELNEFESSQDLPAFDFKDNVNDQYFLLFISQDWFYKSLENIASGTGSKRIHPKSLFKVKVPWPKFAEQQAIASILSESDRELDLLRNRLQKIREQKKGLMQVLLTGKRRLRIKEL